MNGNWTYTYDDMNRLTQGVCTANCPAAQGMTYAYDRFGNRWSEAVTAGSGIQPTYYFNANNQIDISGVTYDAAGNVMNDGLGLGNTYTYDAENRIITAANGYSASYVYDAEGHRVRATVNGQTRDFIYDLSGRNIDEYTPGGSGWLGTWTRGEAYAGNMHIATYANSTTEFDNSDWLSTFRERSDVTGNKVESCTSLPFGEDLTCTGAEVTPIHFTGKERDAESGNDFFEARYYTSTMGRFLTPDWAEKPVNVPYASFGNPQSLNLYSYVGDNPLMHADPDGHCWPAASCYQALANTLNNFATNIQNSSVNSSPTVAALKTFGAGALADTIKMFASPLTMGTATGTCMGGNGCSAGKTALAVGGDVLKGAAIAAPLSAAAGSLSGALDAAPATTTLFRAVMSAEAESIDAVGAFTNPYGVESKYFSTSLDGAQSYASQATQAYGDGPFSFYRAEMPTSAITPEMTVSVDRGINTVVVPTEQLPQLSSPESVDLGVDQ